MIFGDDVKKWFLIKVSKGELEYRNTRKLQEADEEDEDVDHKYTWSLETKGKRILLIKITFEQPKKVSVS
jgi:hypothetical protein